MTPAATVRNARQRKTSRWSLVDLFSGCGGASAGFLSEGAFQPHYAADIDRWANQTYEFNLGHSPDPTDLRAIAGSRAKLARWASDIRSSARHPLFVVGCAPCQGFSSHVKMRGDRHGRNALLESLGNLVVALRPDGIFIENVPDLFAERNWESYKRLTRRLRAAGYRTRAKVINFAQLGVPQERFRGVLLARRDDDPTFPSPTHPGPSSYSTVRQWIGSLPPVRSGCTHPDDDMHQASSHRRQTIETLKRVPRDGGNRPAGVGPACLDNARQSFGGYTDVYGRLAWDQTAPTITARCRTPSCGRFAHPEQHRGLTPREAARLQTFPEEWIFAGPFDDKFKQIGNAVPPLAANVFARHVAAGWPTPKLEVGALEIHDRPIGSSFSVLIPGFRRRERVAV